MALSSAGALVMLFAAGGIVFALGAKRLVGRLDEPRLVRTGAALIVGSLLAIAIALAPAGVCSIESLPQGASSELRRRAVWPSIAAKSMRSIDRHL